jgi:hypothetical protein
VKHAFVKLERDGQVSIRWWVDTQQGVAARTLIFLRPGESAFELPYEEWHKLRGQFVDLDELHHIAQVRPLSN